MSTYSVLIVVVCCLTFAACQDVTYSLLEQKPNGTSLGNVAVDSNLESTVTVDDFNSLKYTLLTQGNPFTSLFKIDEFSGFLYTAEILDREKLCEFSNQCILSLDIVAQSTIGVFFRKLLVDVYLQDINDNSPTFSEPFVKLVFSEESFIGSSLPLVVADDKDIGNNSVHSYTLLTEDSPFMIEFDVGEYPDGISSVRIIVNKTLDRESRDNYLLKILAEDGGVPVNTGTLTVSITVTDVNDNPPVFNSSVYNISVKEDVNVSSVLLTLSATDKDIGQNGEIRYRLSPHQSEVNRNLFAMNATTGELSVAGELVYKTGKVYKVVVQASDQADQPRMDQTTVYVNVLDSTNNRPEINVNILTSSDPNSHTAEVSEFANIGKTVAHVAAVDADTGRNGIISCYLESGHFELQRLDVKEFKVIVKKTLNRELQSHHILTITCQDSGLPPLDNTATFSVDVLDENDNAPRFMKQTYFKTLPENNEIGASLLQVSAVDIDIGKNKNISYSLSSLDYRFAMDSKTGILTAEFVLDREDVSQISFVVLAEDSGSHPLTGSASIVINILDENDNKPDFLNKSYEFVVLENQPINLTVGNVSASDIDEGENGSVTFSLAPGLSSAFPFTILHDGTIKTTQELDREAQSRYDFELVVTDMGSPQLSNTAHVTIVVADDNDNSAVMVFPTDKNNTVKIPYHTPTTSVITTISAYDIDDGQNAILSYNIYDRNVSHLFKIDRRSGDITLLRTLALSDVKQYTFRVLAQDHGNPPKYTTHNLTIIVTSDVIGGGPSSPENEGKYIRIAITIASVTVAVSAAIILTICLIRRLDRRKALEEFNGQGELRNGQGKKVSFSLETPMMPVYDAEKNNESSHSSKRNSLQDMGVSNHINNNIPGSLYDAKCPDSTRPAQDTLAVLQLHKALLQSHDRKWSNQNEQASFTKDMLQQRHEDNHSDTSAETTTSDSGRGGSESDIHSNHGLSVSRDSEMLRSPHTTAKPLVYHCNPRNSWERAEQEGPKTYFQNLRNLRTDSMNSNYRSAPCVARPNSSSSGYNSNRGLTFMPHPGMYMKEQPDIPVRKSRYNVSVISDVTSNSFGTFDDEDDKTTTSGSYTIDQESIYNTELHLPLPGDCIV